MVLCVHWKKSWSKMLQNSGVLYYNGGFYFYIFRHCAAQGLVLKVFYLLKRHISGLHSHCTQREENNNHVLPLFSFLEDLSPSSVCTCML